MDLCLIRLFTGINPKGDEAQQRQGQLSKAEKLSRQTRGFPQSKSLSSFLGGCVGEGKGVGIKIKR